MGTKNGDKKDYPYSPVIPNFWVDSVETMRSFYIEKLGFHHMMGVVGKDGKLDFCIVTRDDKLIMVGRPEEKIDGISTKHEGRRPLEMYIYLKDVDAYYAEVKGRGVAIESPISTQWWGDRNFAVKDPYGYQIWFGETVQDMVPPPGVKVI